MVLGRMLLQAITRAFVRPGSAAISSSPLPLCPLTAHQMDTQMSAFPARWRGYIPQW